VVLHTSGTTGQPKPIAFSQDVFRRRAQLFNCLCGFAPGAVFATSSPFHHIAGLGTGAAALATGVTLVPVARFRVDAWSGLAEYGLTHVMAVPTMIEMLLEAGILRLPTLRTLLYGAAPIHPNTLARVLEVAPDLELVQLFGQTEGSPITCLSPDDHRRAAKEPHLLGSVGRAVPGLTMRIADAGDDGVGEVWAQAPHLAHLDEDGWLHTGDLGRLDDDGYLYLSGRKGDRIVRGGENVHPLEVELVLSRHPGVREVAVVGRADQRWGEIVRAVIVAADPDDPPDVEDLRRTARAELAGFKVPTEWVFSPSLPRNAAGKLLRRMLAG
jgi:acyl-CoA synthetase (AMP-forming)/AMP-acid ligase II